jgi:hypothetical protein
MANLREANLEKADIDFSCLPLSCGGLNWKIDTRIAAQLAYHFCSMKCDDPDFIKLKNNMLYFANQFHHVGDDCDKIKDVYTPSSFLFIL